LPGGNESSRRGFAATPSRGEKKNSKCPKKEAPKGPVAGGDGTVRFPREAGEKRADGKKKIK
jgi:hypothetical protein